VSEGSVEKGKNGIIAFINLSLSGYIGLDGGEALWY
jgi:hypothetical protein